MAEEVVIPVKIGDENTVLLIERITQALRNLEAEAEKVSKPAKNLKNELESIKSPIIKPRVDTAQAVSSLDSIKKRLDNMDISEALSSFTEKGKELAPVLSRLIQETTGFTDAENKLSESLIDTTQKMLERAGLVGQVASVAIGIIGYVTKAEQDQINAQTQANAAAQASVDIQARNGLAYRNLGLNISATATSQERLNQINEEARGLNQTILNQLAQTVDTTRLAAMTEQDYLNRRRDGENWQRNSIRTVRATEESVRDLAASYAAILPQLRAHDGALSDNLTVSTLMGRTNEQTIAYYRQYGIELDLTSSGLVNQRRIVEANAQIMLNNAQIAQRNSRRELELARYASTANFRNASDREAAQQRLARAQAAASIADRNLANATRDLATATREAEEATRKFTEAEEENERIANKNEKQRRLQAAASSQVAVQELRNARETLDINEKQLALSRRLTEARNEYTASQRESRTVQFELAELESQQRLTIIDQRMGAARRDAEEMRARRGENELQRLNRIAQATESLRSLENERGQEQRNADERRLTFYRESDRLEREAARGRGLYDAQNQRYIDNSQAVLEAQRTAVNDMIELQRRENQSIDATLERRANELSLRQQLAGMSQEEISLSRENMSIIRERANESIRVAEVRKQELEDAQSRNASLIEVNRLTNEYTQAVATAASAQQELNRATSELNRPITEFKDKMKEAASTMGSAFVDSLDAALFASENLGRSIVKALQEQLRAIAKESAIKALFETAKGISQFAIGNAASGAVHLKAAGLFAATAVAAGAAAKGIQAAGGSTETEQARSSDRQSRPAQVSETRRPESTEKGYVINITVNGALMNEGVEEGIVRSLDRAASRGLTPRFARLGRG